MFLRTGAGGILQKLSSWYKIGKNYDQETCQISLSKNNCQYHYADKKKKNIFFSDHLISKQANEATKMQGVTAYLRIWGKKNIIKGKEKLKNSNQEDNDRDCI